jgi:hypothetical protein
MQTGPLGQLVVTTKNGRLPTGGYDVVQAVATIPNNSSVSAIVDTSGYIVEEIFIPNTGWGSAASMTINKSIDNTNGSFAPLYDKDGTEYTFTVGAITAPGRFIRVPKGDLDGARYLQLVSGTHASPTNCTGCAIQIILRAA